MFKKYLVVHFYIKRKKEHSWRNTLCCVHLKILKFSYIILLVLFEWFFLLLFLEEQNASKIIASLYHTLCWCLYIIWLMLIALPLLLVMLFFYPSWCHLSNLIFCYFLYSIEHLFVSKVEYGFLFRSNLHTDNTQQLLFHVGSHGHVINIYLHTLNICLKNSGRIV